MIRKINPIVLILLENRYQNKILLEKAPSDKKIREKLGDNLMDISDWLGYTDWAIANSGGLVSGMAQAEVPLAKQDPKKYDKLRSELAKELVLARKNQFDAGNQNPDEVEVLQQALSANPELASVLTRDEYISLAGDITNPLDVVKVSKDETGKQYSDLTKSKQFKKWGGIEGPSEIAYDVLQGAKESMTTPEGIAMAAVGGAAFKGAGALLGAGGKYLLSPAVAKYAPKAAKYLPSAQTVTNVGGLGLIGLGGIQAYSQEELPRYTGSLLGGIPGFRAGEYAAGVAGKAGKEVGKAGVAATKKVAEPVIDLASDIVTTQKEAGFPKAAKDFVKWLTTPKVKIIRGRVNTDTTWKNLSPKEQAARWLRGKETGEETWTPGKEFDPHFPTSPSSAMPPIPKDPTVKDNAIAALVLAASLAAAGERGIPRTAEPTRPAGIVEVLPAETPSSASPRTTRLSGAGGEKPAIRTVERQPSATEVRAPKEKQPTVKVKTPSEIKDTTQNTDTVSKGKEINKTFGKNADKVTSGDTVTAGKEPQGPESGNRDLNLDKAAAGKGEGGGGGESPPPDKVPGKPEPIKPGRVVPPVIPIPGLPGGSGKSLEELLKRGQMSQADIDAILTNLFQTAQTIRIA